MKKILALLGAVAVTGLLATGCAGPQKKLGRGLNNTYEIIRLGEMRRTIEQDTLTDPDARYATSFVKGFNRTLARTGIGLYEVVTFPIPSYKPLATRHFNPNPIYPDSYKPRVVEDSTFATDTSIGFSGGDIAPWFPGSRFHVFDN